jgi:hypothetical protein
MPRKGRKGRKKEGMKTEGKRDGMPSPELISRIKTSPLFESLIPGAAISTVVAILCR